MSGIGVIVNPRSRRTQNDPRAAQRLARALGDHGVVRAARDKEELFRIAEDFRKLKIDVLGISGDLTLDPTLGEGPAPLEIWGVKDGTSFFTVSTIP